MWKDRVIDNGLEKDIRCKCGKLWGMANHRKTCKRCKTPVIARGSKGAK
tara:strand:+ start:1246 stop:1392 length:147 start_codon:yes stop_codon:yes gene_type:complete